MPSPLQQSRINGAIPVLSERSKLGLQSSILILCRIIDPPPNRNRPVGQDTPSNRLDDNAGGVHTNAQQTPAAIGTSSMSSRKYESHDWLMNDSD